MSDDHAGDCPSDGWRDPLAGKRPKELQLLCSAALADVIASEGFTLGRLGAGARNKSLAA
jgi:hypothetical protein